MVSSDLTNKASAWADDADDDGVEDSLPENTVREKPDGTKIITEYVITEDGRRKKITRRTRMRVIRAEVNHEVAARKKWVKFGDATGLKPGPDPNSTTYGEKVYLKLSAKTREEQQPQEETDDPTKKALATTNAKITCRICSGVHFTTKCPLKDTVGAPEDNSPENGAAAAEISTTGKYLPPSARRGAAGAGETMGKDRRDDSTTIRVTNLAEDTTEQDLKDLMSSIGAVSRAYVVRDRDTNVCKGFAFVSFFRREDAEAALKRLDGHGYANLILRVEWARNKE